MRCPKGEESNELTEFYKTSKRPDGVQAWCKLCSAARRAEWGRENPDKIARNSRYVKYRIRDEEYNLMLEEQNNACKLCREAFSSTLGRHIDHDHITGVVRGILCRRCNYMIGWYEAIDDQESVLQYLGRV